MEGLDEFKALRKRILKERRDRREMIEEGLDEEQFQARLKALAVIEALLKEARDTWLNERKDSIEAELMEAYQQNNHSEMHKQRIRYQGNGQGPKKRYYYSPKSHWDAAKWTKELGTHPHAGGLAAESIDLEEWYDEHEKHYDTKMPLPETPELIGLAQRDEGGMLKYCKKAAKRRAFPEW